METINSRTLNGPGQCRVKVFWYLKEREKTLLATFFPSHSTRGHTILARTHRDGDISDHIRSYDQELLANQISERDNKDTETDRVMMDQLTY